MNNLKKIFLVIIFLFFISSCGIFKDETLSVEEVIIYFEKKYNDNFTLVASNIQEWSSNYSELILSSEKLNNSNINVRVYSKDDIIDNYIAVKYKSQVEEKVTPIVREIYGDSLVVNSPVLYGQRHFNENMKFEDYAKNKKSSLSISIATNDDLAYKDEKIRKLVDALKDEKICTDIIVSYYDIDNIHDIKLSHGTGRVYEQWPLVKGVAYVDEDYVIDTLNWAEN